MDPEDEKHRERLYELISAQVDHHDGIGEPYRSKWSSESIRGLRDAYCVDAANKEKLILFAVNEDEHPVGFLAMKYSIAGNGERSVFIEELFVEDVYRGQGYGSALLNEVKRTAVAHGWDSVYLQCFNKNEESVRFYERFGMIAVKTVYYMPLNG